MQITSLHSLNAFLLPIKTVGVQVTLTTAVLSAHLCVCVHVCVCVRL